jgi:hypothetical protein
VFAYGICIGPSDKYEKFAAPSLQAIAPTSMVIERRGQSSIFEAYNSMLDEVRAAETPLEGLILMHEDIELKSPIEDVLRAEFSDPDVAIVGAIGGRGVKSVRWSRAEKTFGRAPDAFYGENNHGGGFHDVDMVDGLLLALSPWAIDNMRFDTDTFTGFHAYDADISLQARAAGKKVRVAELDIFHHTGGGFGDPAKHREVDDTFRKKWNIPLDSPLFRMRRKLQRKQY